MLETRSERVKLLRAGFNGKDIEMLYIICNNIKIIDGKTRRIVEQLAGV